MAGVQGSDLAIAVSNAGGLGSLPCAMLSPEQIRLELSAIRAKTHQPFNVNFFCHTPPEPDATREAAWRAVLSRYYQEFGIDARTIPQGPGRDLSDPKLPICSMSSSRPSSAFILDRLPLA